MLIAALMLLITGCSSDSSPKEALVSALNQMQEAKSYSVKGTLNIDELKVPADSPTTGANGQMAAMILQLLQGATIAYTGNVQAEPARSELTLDIKLNNPMLPMDIRLPIIVTKEKAWLKLSQVPLLSLPDNMAEQWFEIDLAAMAKEQANSAEALDARGMQQMIQELTGIVVKAYEGDDYFTAEKAESLPNLPSDVQPDQVVRFEVTPANGKAAIDTFASDVLPQWVDVLLEKEAYRKMLQLDEAQLERVKANLAEEGADSLQAQLKNNVTTDELSLTGAIKDDYLVYQELVMKLAYQDKTSGTGTLSRIGLRSAATYEHINEALQFEYDLPTEAIPLEKLAEQLNIGMSAP
ncbi:hypothetical protein FHS18_005896 [Paenibacillus phyllosphaerae]|uniref:Uncharacterized protein n=1 Tax=Paenibacillus phyllosphaerae TaxID=274593 RepID=A0A7W5B3S5_9BACL|nr:hypothetical protein [Paenibacillus phyllosphaerae]MBB3113783.1 hypothetical protein [Paenibacillus phyllosphaerae]